MKTLILIIFLMIIMATGFGLAISKAKNLQALAFGIGMFALIEICQVIY